MFLVSDRKFWVWYNSLRLFSKLVLPVYLTFMLFYFSIVYPFSTKASIDQIPKLPFIICLGMALFITCLDEGFLPTMHNSYEQKTYQRELAQTYHTRANQAFEKGDYEEAYKNFTAYLSVDSTSSYDAALIEKDKKQNQQYKYLTSKDFYDQLAEKREEERRIFSAEQIDPEKIYVMKNVGNNFLLTGLKEGSIEKLLKAYNTYNDLLYINPGDEETLIKLAETKNILFEKLFFRNTIKNMEEFPSKTNIKFINVDREDFQQIIEIDKMYTFKNETYFADVRIIETYTNTENDIKTNKVFGAPYGRLVGKKILFLNTDQYNNSDILSCREITSDEIAANSSASDNSIDELELEIPTELIKFFSEESDSFKKMNISSILYIKTKYKFEDIYTNLTELEILKRLRKIFSLFTIPLFAIYIAFKTRPKLNHPEYGYVMFYPVILIALATFIHGYYLLGEALYTLLVVKTNFLASLLIMLASQILFLSIAIIAIFRFKRNFSAFLELRDED